MESFKFEDDQTDCAKSLTHKEKLFIITKIKKHKNWTSEEDRLLLQVANNFQQKSWTQVAGFFKDKNPAQCRARYKRIRPGIIKGPWTKEEDKQILELVKQNGRNWALISKMMTTRNGKQIRDRFLNYLDPEINKIKFKKEEDDKIIDLYKEHGSKWSVIAKSFPGRTGDMIKNRFYSCLKRRIHIYELTKTNKKDRRKYYRKRKLLQKKEVLKKCESNMNANDVLENQSPNKIPENQNNTNYSLMNANYNHGITVDLQKPNIENNNNINFSSTQQFPSNNNYCWVGHGQVENTKQHDINNSNLVQGNNLEQFFGSCFMQSFLQPLSAPSTHLFFNQIINNSSKFFFQKCDEQMLTYLYHLQQLLNVQQTKN
jgi:hypothetical protein